MSSLRNKTVVITRPRSQYESFANLVSSFGAKPISFPTIEISPLTDTVHLDQSLKQLENYDWLILTSVNGVEVVWERLGELGIDALPPGLKIAAIGPKTATALKEQGVHPSFVPEEYIAEAIYPGLGNVRDKRVLLARAEQAREALPQLIEEGGGVAEVVSAYRTFPASPDKDGLDTLRNGVDVITFTSSSTVENFITLLKNAEMRFDALGGDPICAAIGPITARTAQEFGLPIRVVATTYTIEGLAQAISKYYQEQIMSNG